MQPHKPPFNNYECITELIINLQLNDEREEDQVEDLPPYQIVRVDMDGYTVYFPDPCKYLKQLPSPI